mmetsp:Transcript_37133/g.69392  ORF Transcript_37133/g.69392 Transcript_37133/m.69392 type:complete len:414 (+) Transcript_37133:696-1937(+)
MLPPRCQHRRVLRSQRPLLRLTALPFCFRCDQQGMLLWPRNVGQLLLQHIHLLQLLFSSAELHAQVCDFLLPPPNPGLGLRGHVRAQALQLLAVFSLGGQLGFETLRVLHLLLLCSQLTLQALDFQLLLLGSRAQGRMQVLQLLVVILQLQVMVVQSGFLKRCFLQVLIMSGSQFLMSVFGFLQPALQFLDLLPVLAVGSELLLQMLELVLPDGQLRVQALDFLLLLPAGDELQLIALVLPLLLLVCKLFLQAAHLQVQSAYCLLVCEPLVLTLVCPCSKLLLQLRNFFHPSLPGKLHLLAVYFQRGRNLRLQTLDGLLQLLRSHRVLSCQHLRLEALHEFQLRLKFLLLQVTHLREIFLLFPGGAAEIAVPAACKGSSSLYATACSIESMTCGPQTARLQQSCGLPRCEVPC